MSEMIERVARAIEEHFLANGKWELDNDDNPQPHIIGGRWLWLSDANYGFRPIDLAKDMIEAMQEPTKDILEAHHVVPDDNDFRERAKRNWHAMIDAALGKVDA